MAGRSVRPGDRGARLSGATYGSCFERPGYKTKSETLDVPANNPVRGDTCSIRKDETPCIARPHGFAPHRADRCAPVAPGAQTVRTPRCAAPGQAFENLDYRQALTIAQGVACGNGSPVRARARYELLGFTYSGLDSILKAVDAFKQVVLSSRSETSIPIVPRRRR